MLAHGTAFSALRSAVNTCAADQKILLMRSALRIVHFAKRSARFYTGNRKLGNTLREKYAAGLYGLQPWMPDHTDCVWSLAGGLPRRSRTKVHMQMPTNVEWMHTVQ